MTKFNEKSAPVSSIEQTNPPTTDIVHLSLIKVTIFNTGWVFFPQREFLTRCQKTVLPVKPLEVHSVLYQVSCLNNNNIPQCSSCTRRILSINLNGKDKQSLYIQNNVTICELPIAYSLSIYMYIYDDNQVHKVETYFSQYSYKPITILLYFSYRSTYTTKLSLFSKC